MSFFLLKSSFFWIWSDVPFLKCAIHPDDLTTVIARSRARVVLKLVEAGRDARSAQVKILWADHFPLTDCIGATRILLVYFTKSGLLNGFINSALERYTWPNLIIYNVPPGDTLTVRGHIDCRTENASVLPKMLIESTIKVPLNKDAPFVKSDEVQPLRKYPQREV